MGKVLLGIAIIQAGWQGSLLSLVYPATFAQTYNSTNVCVSASMRAYEHKSTKAQLHHCVQLCRHKGTTEQDSAIVLAQTYKDTTA